MYIRIVFFKLILQIYTTLLSTRPQPLFGRHLKKTSFLDTVYHTRLKRGKISNFKYVFLINVKELSGTTCKVARSSWQPGTTFKM